MTTHPYVYRIAETVKVTDGDTIWAKLNVGFRQTLLVDLRLLGYDCPERTRGSDMEKAAAIRATAVTRDFLTPSDGTSLWVRTEPAPDDFGRWLGDIWRESNDQPERHLGAELRNVGLASIWPTRWHQEFDVG